MSFMMANKQKQPETTRQLPTAQDLTGDPILRGAGMAVALATAEEVLLEKRLVDADLHKMSEITPDSLLQDVLLAPSQPAPAGAQGSAQQPQSEAAAQAYAVSQEEQDLPQPPIAAVQLGENDAKPEITVSADGLTAYICLHAPKEDGRDPTRQELDALVGNARICHGINQEVLQGLAEHPTYETELVLAEGAVAENGEDGTVEHLFDAAPDLAPAEAEDGTVDYRNVRFFSAVSPGDVLSEITPPTSGANGRNVYGKVLWAKSGKPAPAINGSNTEYTPDHRKLLSTIEGQALLKGDKVTVSRVMTVKNVDASTGNILFVGSLIVNEDVKAGYTIRVGGDITVHGMVESATLVAGGNVVLGKGMNGNQTGSITSGGDVRSKFIENATVTAKKSVYADVLLNCKVTANEKIELKGGRGALIGGICRAGQEVKCVNLGNGANVPTKIEIFGLNSIRKEKEELTLRDTTYQQTEDCLKQLVQAVSKATALPQPVRERAMLRAVLLRRLYEAERRRMLERVEFLADEADRLAEAVAVSVRGTMYSNVTFDINSVVYKNRDNRTFSTIRLHEGEITFGAAKK